MRPKKIEEQKLHSFKVNDLVPIKDPDSAVFEPRFQPNYRVTAIFGDNRIEVQDEKEHKSVRRSSHVKYVEPSEKVIQQLPNKKILQNYGRSAKLLIAAKDIPNLDFQLEKSQDTSECGEHSINSLEGTGDVVQVMECDVLSQSSRRNAKESSQDSKVRKHSINSLSSAAGAAVQPITTETMTEIAANMGPQKRTSEYSEDSRNSQELEMTLCMKRSTENFIDDQCDQTLSRTSECSEHSMDSWEKSVTKNADVQASPLQQVLHDNTPHVTCTGKSSESLTNLSNGVKCIGNNVLSSKFSWLKSMSQIVGLTAAWHKDKAEGSPVGANTVSSGKTNITSVHSEFNFFL